MFKFVIASAVFLSSHSALAGGIICTTKNVLGFADQFFIGYTPGPAGVFEEISFDRCENPVPGEKCLYKPAKKFNLDLVEDAEKWPLGTYSAKAADGSAIVIRVIKRVGETWELEGTSSLTFAGGGKPWENELSCDTAE